MMQISLDDLRGALEVAARSVVAEDDARYFAAETVETHLRKSPRTNPVKEAIADLEASYARRHTTPTRTTDLAAATRIDFAGHGPSVHLRSIHDELARKASSAGLAMTAFANSAGLHTLHLWVQGLARRGLVAIVMANGGPNAVVPHNGTRGVFGTNPMAYGIPGPSGEPVCVDMATSEIPYFEILAAHRDGAPLRPGAAVDMQGEPTAEAAAALDFSASATDPVSNLLPMGGGYKGFALVYLLEILTSGLVGMPASPSMSPDFVAEEHGGLLLAFSPAALGSEHALSAAVASLDQAVRSQPARPGSELRMPGEGNSRRYAEAGGSIELAEDVWQRLESLPPPS